MMNNLFGAKPYNNELYDLHKTSTYKHLFHEESRAIRSSRDLDKFLEHYTNHGSESCYIFTGRGPSSADMHLGHMLPFMVTRELQKCLGIRVVIQLTDDEKFLFRGEYTLEKYNEFAHHNKTLIMKCGFDPALTQIFIDTEDIAKFYPTMLKIQNKINFSEIKAVFGLKDSDSIGKIGFPALEMAPCDPRSVFSSRNMRCLVVCAWDQDPFFRLFRDYAKSLKCKKPSLLHLNYLPALNGSEKMSTTGTVSNYSIWLSDTPNVVQNKIKRHALSGGQDTAELQQELGANLDVDVSIKYLNYFMTDREQFRDICQNYKSGKLDTKSVKEMTIACINSVLGATVPV